MRGLQGKVAIVPGGATKIGQAVVQAFQDAGVRVMVADIATDAGKGMVRDGVAFQACDLRSDADIAALVAETKKQFGRIDFLVNVARWPNCADRCSISARRSICNSTCRVPSSQIIVVGRCGFRTAACPGPVA